MSAAAPGPDDEAPAGEAERFLALAASHAGPCGVTRLADITGLDTIGLPVWQAVRPAGKALSVHQGKAASPLGAKIGALCEAIESHCAENVAADGPRCGFDDLPEHERAADASDYARRRDHPPPGGAIDWCRADEAIGGGAFHLPHDLVSLDLTVPRSSPFDRSSAGLGLGPDPDAATAVSLREVIERDCVGAWQRRPLAERMEAAVDLDEIPYGWLAEWRRRLAGQDIDVALFAPEPVVEVPVAICWIGGVEAYGTSYRSFSGSACHHDPERTLFQAFAEAVQSRLTFIAGVRDDILPSHYAERGSALPGAMRAQPRRRWDPDAAGPPGWEGLADRLAAAGYDRVAVKRLDVGLDRIAVTKAFVPGLGSLKRTRRSGR